MICFEITLNGEKICTAGLPDGVLDFDMIWLGPDERRPQEPNGVGHWSIGGRTEEHGFVEHVWWKCIQKLSEGDVLTVRVVSSQQPDQPIQREREKDA